MGEGMSIFQKLYDLEINFSISCFWDNGFDVFIGDDMNGHQAEGRVYTWAEVEAWLEENARIQFPDAFDGVEGD